jgi:ribosomal protein L13E
MHHIKPIITLGNGKQREGKGFSPDEIKEAGLNAGDARRLCLPVDRKRKTCHDENIANIKSHLSDVPAKAAPKATAAESNKKSAI